MASESEQLMTIVSQKEVHENAIAHGWWETKRPVPELLCLIHSEVSEALEGHRKGLVEGQKGCLGEELADIVIRVFDMAEAYEIDMVKQVSEKHEYNKTRPYRHGGKVC